MRAFRPPSALNLILALPLCLSFFLVVSGLNHKLQSASLTSVSVTSSNPRPSFRGGLAAGNVVSSSTVIITTTPGSYPSTTSAQLVAGDELRIGEGGSLGQYFVASTSTDSTFFITGDLDAGDADQNDDVIATSSASLTARFTTASAIPNGRFRILVPGLQGGAGADGIPDGGYFDFGNASPGPASVTCPGNADTTYDFVSGVATASSQVINGTYYHVFECAYSGTGATNTTFTGTPGGSDGALQISNIINPAPKTGHTTGVADTYNVIVQQLDSNLNVQDTTTVQIAVIEAVRVTASVPPQITFQILGLPSGTAGVCGLTTNVTTTAASVPFGEVSISSFTNAGQAMSVSTNATNGYSVTAIENNQLARNGTATCTGQATSDEDCIPDSPGDGSTMAPDNTDDWVLVASKGFGYSLDNENSIAGNFSPEFTYDGSVGADDCTGGTYCARQFASAAVDESETAQPIFGNTGVADNDNLYVCYKIVVAATQAAGNYENYITYNATATF